MFIALAFAAASVAVPPVTVDVHAAPNIPRVVIKAALEEAAAIWRKPGVALVWQLDETASAADGRSLPFGPSLHVSFDDEPSTVKDHVGVIGWIVFSGSGTPRPEIHLSHGNAWAILIDAFGEGGLNRMTIAERRTMMARALGRALAHEIGHYLLASKEHSVRGLMKARDSTSELFGPQHATFDLTPVQRSTVISRLVEAEQLTRR